MAGIHHHNITRVLDKIVKSYSCLKTIKRIKIIDDFKFFDRIRWDLNKQFQSEYPLIFEHTFIKPSFQIDHIKAIVNGGDMWDEKNMRCLCEECHKKKTKEDLIERKRNKIKTKEL